MGLRIVALDDYQGLVERMGLAERIAAELEAAGLGEDAAEVEVVALREHISSENLLAQKMAGAEVVVAMRERTGFSDTLLALLPDLRLLVTTGMRNASINLTAARENGVTVCGTGSPATASTAELAWGLILGVLRNIPQEDASVRRGGWQHTVGRDLNGLRLGLVGFGHIGHQMARIAAAFNMEVAAWSPNLHPEVAAAAGVTAVTKEELFSTSDVVSIHLVLSARTRHIIADDDLKLMKPTAILINTSRWAIVEDSALARMLARGTIAGAGIDVWHDEPMLPGDPWRNAPRSVLTPHLGYVTERTMEHWHGEIARDIAAWRSGEPVRVIRPEEG
jgi:phosphoglycerate dehydrogenase-like enzyme